MPSSSRIPKFYNLPPEKRLAKIAEICNLTQEEVSFLSQGSGLSLEQANRMIENVIGLYSLPLGIATNFIVNATEVLVPMVLEEPSVVAAASNAARMTREHGGFVTSSTDPIMIGQIQVLNVADPHHARHLLFQRKEELLKLANEQDPILVKFGGGARDITARIIDSPRGQILVVHLLVNVQDAMGANAVNTMAEALAPRISEIVNGQVNLRILSNLAIHRLARATAVFSKNDLGGPEVVERILDAYNFAIVDPFRAATHNKGIMNGIIAVALATGNDTRALEAGAHTYASYGRPYQSLTSWEKNLDGDLVGSIELPLAVGLIGGATKTHPIARIAIKILGVTKASELSEIMAAVGLAQNLGALRALAAEGIQKGHMALHSRNVAVMAGATGSEIDKVADQIVSEGKVRIDRAKEVLDQLHLDS